MKNIILVLGLLTMLHSACSKSDDSSSNLPPITQTGENTFGCLINGRLLIPRDGTGTFNSPDKGMRFIKGPGPEVFTYNEIRITDFEGSNGGSIDLHIINLDKIVKGNFEIEESNCKRGLDANKNLNIRCQYFNGSNYEFYCSIEGTGLLNISRYDPTGRILSGTFSFSAKNENDADDIIEITDGRFDLNLNTLRFKNFP